MPRAALIRISCAAAAAGGLAMGLVECAMAASRAERRPLSGLATILGADLTGALLLGVVQGIVLALVVTPAQLAAGLRAVARARRPQAPAIEAGLVAGAIAAATAAAGAAVLLFRLDRAAVVAVAADRGAWVAPSLTAALIVAAAAGAGALLHRALRPPVRRLCERAPRIVALRTLVAIAVLLALAAAVVARAPLGALAAAFDLRPLVLLVVFAVVDTAIVAAAVCAPRAEAVVRRATQAVPLAGLAAALLGAWLVALGPGSDDRAAVRLYRREAPLAGAVVERLAAAIDRDDDGYSAYFGDGDCAPGDPARNPGAADLPGDGVDQDCFDGDLPPDALPRPPPPHPRPALPADVSFVVIFIDTLRPDHLGAYGHERPTSPNIDRLARESVIFERAYGASTYTTASLAGFATARPPGHAGRELMSRKSDDIPASLPAVVEAFRDAGWKTRVVTDLASRAPAAFRGTQVSKGFHRRPTEVVPHAVEMLDDLADDRFFLVVYFAGPHAPYRRSPGAPDFGNALPDLYDSAVASTDAELTALLDRLDAPDLRSRVVVTLVSDHGEAFGEHGVYYHGRNVHEETVRIPMLFRVPGVAPGRRAGPVSLIDVAPTLLNLAGLPQLPGSIGHDLTGALLGAAEEPDRTVFVEAEYPKIGYQAAVVGRRYKLILEAKSRTLLVYDLERDPGETRDIAGAVPDVVVALRRVLSAQRSYLQPVESTLEP